MPTRNVRLTDHQARLLDVLVESGRFQNASEAIREGLRLVELREAEEAVILDWFNARIAGGLEQARKGEFVGDLDDVLREINDELDAEADDAA